MTPLSRKIQAAAALRRTTGNAETAEIAEQNLYKTFSACSPSSAFDLSQQTLQDDSAARGDVRSRHCINNPSSAVELLSTRTTDRLPVPRVWPSSRAAVQASLRICRSSVSSVVLSQTRTM